MTEHTEAHQIGSVTRSANRKSIPLIFVVAHDQQGAKLKSFLDISRIGNAADWDDTAKSDSTDLRFADLAPEHTMAIVKDYPNDLLATRIPENPVYPRPKRKVSVFSVDHMHPVLT